ncbi:type VII secretion system-associated protein [Amycolatopsis sp. Hca4]|uniref:type VII secretion system-associated protein n=1 Tax=Amycolatopsis sp. Hca4 TaxID=2742131 RepID=UPI00159223B8|nr:type VII secretion system-associated protein [Amycolatopsis sp. Hca4]QKV74005.1 type VII secretion system-associated protein [Amycolatopsis sp. Hca4]
MATTTEPNEAPADGPLENWFLLMDPAWSPATEDAAPPVEAVVGLWPVAEDGRLGKFRANPEYMPADEHSPSDPLDAVLRLVLQGRAEASHIQLVVRETLVDVAMNGDGRPLVTRSPDDVPCIVVATGEPHRRRVASPGWRRVDLGELTGLLAEGVDVLFNPGGPAAVRLTGDFLRETLAMDEARVAELHGPGEHDVSGLRIVPWEPAADRVGESG